MSRSTRWVIVFVLVIAGLFALNLFTTRASAPPTPTLTDPGSLPGLLTGNTPWDANSAQLLQRLKIIGFDASPMEGSAMHIHQHLDIIIDGKPVSIPANIGINQVAGFLSPVHTHDTSGVIHVESANVRDFTLGQFFDVWGVRFTSECIGGSCASGDKALKVFVNGQAYSGDPRQLILKEHQEIVITYGNGKEMPASIPSSYSFPAGD